MPFDVPVNIIQWAQAASGNSDVQAALIVVSYYESSWNPNAIGDNGTSFGLMQMHQGGGLGDGYTQEQLLDGPTNFRLAAQYIEGRLSQGANLYDALQPWTTRDLAWPKIQEIRGSGAGFKVLPLLIVAGIILWVLS